MISLDQLPPMHFRLERVYALKQSCEPEHETSDLPEDPQLGFGWDWRILEQDLFDVAISVQVAPSRGRPDKVFASVVGVFRFLNVEGPPLPFESFVQVNAPAILLPYAREIISSLTSRSYHGVFYLPPVNVQKALEALVREGGTGDRQMRDNPALGLNLRALPASSVPTP